MSTKSGYSHLQENYDQPPSYASAPAFAPGNVVIQQPGYVTATTTTVVSQQPVAMKRDWSSGICDCCKDMKSCCLAYWLGGFYIGTISSRMGEHYCVGCCLNGLWPMRSTFRERHGIQGDMLDDCCKSTWCGLCVACQLSREMNSLGYPSGSC